MIRIFGLLTACLVSMQSSAAPDGVPILNSESTTIDGITINASEKEIFALLGKPDSINYGKFLPPENLPTKTLYYKSHSALIVNDMLYGIDCKDLDCKTNLGARIGDSLAEVRYIYGEGDSRKNDSGDTVLDYKLNDANASLLFLFDGKRVSHIRLIRWPR